MDLLTGGKETMWQNHSIFVGLAWGVTTPVTVAWFMVRDAFSCAANRKGGITWFNVYMWLDPVLVVFTTLFFAVSMQIFKDTGRKHFAALKPHHVIGLVVFVLAST